MNAKGINFQLVCASMFFYTYFHCSHHISVIRILCRTVGIDSNTILYLFFYLSHLFQPMLLHIATVPSSRYSNKGLNLDKCGTTFKRLALLLKKQKRKKKGGLLICLVCHDRLNFKTWKNAFYIFFQSISIVILFIWRNDLLHTAHLSVV